MISMSVAVNSIILGMAEHHSLQPNKQFQFWPNMW